MRYTSQQYMVMAIAFGGAISITPFALFRLYSGDWLIAAVDSCMVAGMFSIGLITYRSHSTHFTGVALSILGLAGMTSVIYIKGPDLVYWAYPTMVSLYFILAPKPAVTLTLITTAVLSFTLYLNMQFIQFVAVIMTLLVNNIFAFLFANRMQSQRNRLHELVRKDSLTGVGNRRALDEKVEELKALHKRNHHNFSIIIFDADHFKNVNDNYGHAVGDKVLINLAMLIERRIRTTDDVYRYGGEEFVVVLFGADVVAANKVSEELRKLIESAEFVEGLRITISLGVAEYKSNEETNALFERADKALYAAKNSGRNQTCIAE